MRCHPHWPLVVMVCFSLFLTGGIDRKTQNALKVAHILKKIEKKERRSATGGLTEIVTETELNDYIDFRLAREKSSIFNRINVNLLAKNRVDGKLRMDAKSNNLSLIFGDVLDIDFKGVLYTRNGMARMDLSTLLLNGRSVAPEMLDFVIRTAAAANGAESGSIRDWYAMPKGIKRIKVENHIATLYY